MLVYAGDVLIDHAHGKLRNHAYLHVVVLLGNEIKAQGYLVTERLTCCL
jgi:hypothetical protein